MSLSSPKEPEALMWTRSHQKPPWTSIMLNIVVWIILFLWHLQSHDLRELKKDFGFLAGLIQFQMTQLEFLSWPMPVASAEMTSANLVAEDFKKNSSSCCLTYYVLMFLYLFYVPVYNLTVKSADFFSFFFLFFFLKNFLFLIILSSLMCYSTLVRFNVLSFSWLCFSLFCHLWLGVAQQDKYIFLLTSSISTQWLPGTEKRTGLFLQILWTFKEPFTYCWMNNIYKL